MLDQVLLKKIKIWLKLPIFLRKRKTYLHSNYGSIMVYWANNMMIIHEIYIKSKYRGLKIWSNLVNELEKMNINIKIQSILNYKLMKYLVRRGWKKISNELSVFLIRHSW